MTLHQARKQAFVEFIEARKGKIIVDWVRITEIREKIGCTKHQLDKIIDELQELGDLVLGIYRGKVVIKLVDTKESAAGGHAGSAR